MALSTAEWALIGLLSLANVVVLTVGLVLSIVAARGFSDAPFGRMLRPLPVMFLAFLLVNAPWTTELTGWPGYVPAYSLAYAVVFTAAVLAAVWAALQAVFLLTERREL
jgi:hypothetical protein